MDCWSALIIGATLFVAYANGANDNFKGVATLFGSGAADYDRALGWATITTVAGSLTALFLATRLISVFQGNGLLPRSLAESEPLLVAVILGAALTVFLATKIGIPISTTHSLTGALFGSGLVAAGFELGFHTLVTSFFLPLLISPVLAVILTLLGSPLFTRALRFAGLTKQNCVCLGSQAVPASVTPEGYVMSQSTAGLRIIVDSEAVCVQRLAGSFLGVNGQKLVDLGHFFSAGAVSFARGLNDTPKIVALALVGSTLDLTWSIGFIALVMALGGLISAGKVAETVSQRITGMDPDQGFLANLVTSFLVIFASRWGLPVSTTHVSCGALFGIGIANGQARWGVIRTILLAWIVTLPFAGISAGLIYWILAGLAPS
jgi:PiT family inorganic phosphate transporter